ncbi:MAG: CoA transferase [Pseudomonadota bacterium]
MVNADETKPTSHGPLKNIRVIELGQLIAGPYCGQLMADFGADVIKVEPPGKGDPMRVWGRGDYPLWWTVCARNKRCVTANLREPEGQDLIKRLVKEADILLENFRPGTMEKWGLDYETLKAINPGLIMVRVSGYGQTGPYSRRAGYAAIGEAMGGMRYLSGFPDRRPSRTGLSLGDTLAATYACVGALAALEHRRHTGEGQVVDAAIYESVLATMEATIPEYTVSHYIRERSGSVLPNVAPSNIYHCQDGEIIIAANQDTVFARLCKAMERTDLVADERYATHTARGANQDELDNLIDAWSNGYTMDEVEEMMVEHGVPCGKVYRAPEMLKDPHFEAREAIVDVDHPKWDTLKMQNVFPKLSATPGEVRWIGPELGEHTEEVYRSLLDLSDEDMEDLGRRGII